MRVLLLGGTSEIGLAILSALALGPDAEVILAGRDPQRLARRDASEQRYLERTALPPLLLQVLRCNIHGTALIERFLQIIFSFQRLDMFMHRGERSQI